MVTKVEKILEDGSWLNPKSCYNGSSASKLIRKYENVQRSSPGRRVEPQANGGRKIQPLIQKGEYMIYARLERE